jgi:hypothetical protein
MLSIREMRSSLKSQSEVASFHGAPDWAIRHIYEARHGLRLSKIGRPAHSFTRAELRTRYETRSTVAQPSTNDEAERERMKLRLQILS